jgi:arsenate reductase-like glutaredoxin family protein
MPQLSDEEIDKILGVTNLPISGKPAMAAGEQPAPPLNAGPSVQSHPQNDWMARNSRGLMIDLSQQAPYEMQKELLKRRRPEDQISYLESQVGKGYARLADDGTALIVQQDPESNEPYEIPVVRPDMTFEGAVARGGSALSEAAGALMGIIATKKIPTPTPVVRWLKDAFGAAVGQEAGGLAQDIDVSLAPMTQLAKERAERVPVSTVANLGMEVGAAAAAKVITPFRGTMPELTGKADAAVEYFAKKYNETYPRSLADRTGSIFLHRIESALSRAPGASATFNKLKAEKLASFQRIQAKVLSEGADATDTAMLKALEEDVGEDAINVIRNNIDPIRKATLAAEDETQAEATRAAMEEFGAAAPEPRQLYPHKVGEALRAKVFADKAKFKADSDAEYNALYELPGGTDKIVEPPNLVSEAKELLKKQPSAKETTQVPLAIVGPTGEPIMMAETKEVLKKQFVDPGVISRLKELSQPGEYSLRDLVSMRRNVRESIDKGEALPNIDTHYMGQIEKLLTRAIDEGTAALPDASIRTAWQTANANYAKGAERFSPYTISRVFKNIESGGFVKDEQIVTGLDSTDYARWKTFLGENSTEFRGLQRSIVDQLIETSRPDVASKLLDGQKLLNNLNSFVTKNRTVAEDILGKDRVDELANLGKLMEHVKGGKPIFDYEQFTQALARGDDLGQAVQRLALQQAKEADLYRSNMTKWIADGKVGQNFNATEFFDYYYKTASPKELTAIVDQLKDNPEVLTNLRRKVMERMFYEAQGPVGPGDVSRVEAGKLFRPLKTSSLEKVIGTEENKGRLKIILGDQYEDFAQLGHMLRTGEVAEQTFAGAGRLSAQMQTQEMLRGGLLNYASDFARQVVGAFIYSNRLTEKWAGNKLFASDEGRIALMRAMLVSKPFVDAMTQDMGTKKAQGFIDYLLNKVNLYEERGPENTAVLRNQQWVDRLIDQNRPRVTPVGQQPQPTP